MTAQPDSDAADPRRSPPTYADVVDGAVRSSLAAGGLGVMLVGGLATAGAAILGAPTGALLVIGATIPAGVLVAGAGGYREVRRLGAGRARALGYTLRLGVQALLELTP